MRELGHYSFCLRVIEKVFACEKEDAERTVLLGDGVGLRNGSISIA